MRPNWHSAVLKTWLWHNCKKDFFSPYFEAESSGSNTRTKQIPELTQKRTRKAILNYSKIWTCNLWLSTFAIGRLKKIFCNSRQKMFCIAKVVFSSLSTKKKKKKTLFSTILSLWNKIISAVTWWVTFNTLTALQKYFHKANLCLNGVSFVL